MTKAYVRGAWVEGSGGTFPVTDPATGEEIARVADCTVQDVNIAIGRCQGKLVGLRNCVARGEGKQKVIGKVGTWRVE